jgi:biopolymer transport protein TolR
MAGLTPGNGAGGPNKIKLMADINITPMVDVMLVLLVIFMVTAPLLVAGVRVDLPRTAAVKIGPVQKPAVVTLAADGSLYVGDDPVARDALERRLIDLRGGDDEAVVYIKADRKIAYGDVLEVLGRIGQTGYRHISLLSQAGGTSENVPNPPASKAGGAQ